MKRLLTRRAAWVAAAGVLLSLLGLGAPRVHANPAPWPGLNLAWNNCLGVSGSAADMSYVCDGSMDGVPMKLVFSFICPPGGLTNFNAISADVAIAANDGTGTLPDYWRVGSGECREGMFRFPGPLVGIGNGSSCMNPWSGSTGGAFNVATQYYSPTKSRVQLAFASSEQVALNAGQHYVGGVMMILADGDVDPTTMLPPGPCSGCELPMCVCLESVTLHQAPGTPPADQIYMAGPGTRNYVSWQGGAVPGSGCPGATPARNRTWGSLKSLYR